MTDYITVERMLFHDLKCWPEPFALIISGKKAFEIRRNDRDYKVGDKLILREYFHGQGKYSGRKVTAEVLSVIEGWGLTPGYVCMGIKLVYGSLIDNPCANALTEDVRDYLEAVRRDTGADYAGVSLSGNGPKLQILLTQTGHKAGQYSAQLNQDFSRQVIKQGTAFILKQAKRFFLGLAPQQTEDE